MCCDGVVGGGGDQHVYIGVCGMRVGDGERDQFRPSDARRVSLAFGLVITIMIYAVGHISGAHMNPAVTLAFAIARHFPWTQVLALLITLIPKVS